MRLFFCFVRFGPACFAISLLAGAGSRTAHVLSTAAGARGRTHRAEPGQRVEVVGTTSPGEYAPIVVPERVSVLGEAPLPNPKPVTYEQLASGQEDSQFVEIA